MEYLQLLLVRHSYRQRAPHCARLYLTATPATLLTSEPHASTTPTSLTATSSSSPSSVSNAVQSTAPYLPSSLTPTTRPSHSARCPSTRRAEEWPWRWRWRGWRQMPSDGAEAEVLRLGGEEGQVGTHSEQQQQQQQVYSGNLQHLQCLPHAPTTWCGGIGVGRLWRRRDAAVVTTACQSSVLCSPRGCHTQSIRQSGGGGDDKEKQSSVSGSGSGGGGEAPQPSLLQSILRRLEDGCEQPQAGRSGGQSSYVPLLFRPDFVKTATMRRQQQLSASPQPPPQEAKTHVQRKEDGRVGEEYACTSRAARKESTELHGGRDESARVTESGESLPHLHASDEAASPAPLWHDTHAEDAAAEGLTPHSSEAEESTTAVMLPLPAENEHDDRADLYDDFSGGTDVAISTDSMDEDGTTSASSLLSQAPRPRTSRRLILDPIEWLAQAADAPLMDDGLLRTHAPITDRFDTTTTTQSSPTHGGSSMVSEAHWREELSDSSRAAESGTVAKPFEPAAHADDADDAVALPPPVSRAAEEREAELLADLLSDVPRPRRRSPKNTRPPHAASAEATTDAAPAPASASPAVDGDALVYNVFTRRVAKASSASIRMLALLGISVDPESRELRLTDREALEGLATELRANRVSWPQLWSRGTLYRQLERVLSDATVKDAAGHVAQLLQLQYAKSHLKHQRPGLVVAGAQAADGSSDGGSEGSAASSSSSAPDADGATSVALPPVAENLDDKLIALQDLNAEQQAVVELVMKGYHTYIGGGAGTGKSVLLRLLRQQLAREGLAVAATGTTGIAGTQIGGSTLHHCLGINLSGEFTRRKELSSYDVLIIDEVSMLSRELFESLELHLRRANNVNLPFGGVQVILCGDFLQLGAIDSRPLITSPLFRRHFVQLKLRTVVRQEQNLRFAAQLQQLRRGRVPADLAESVRFVSREDVLAEQQAEAALRQRQQQQLAALALTVGDAAPALTGEQAGSAVRAESRVAFSEYPLLTAGEEAAEPSSTPPSPDTYPPIPAATPFVNDAVNLLPTNREVGLTNMQQLQQLPGDLVTYAPQFLPPALVGFWSPTFVLRIDDPARLDMKVLRMELLRYLATFYTHGARPAAATAAAAALFSDGEWLTNPVLGERCVVLYRLFTDALTLRVRLPLTLDKEEARQFLLHVDGLHPHLEAANIGVRVREVLPHGDGMHTERDEYILSQYAARAPLAQALELKVGARVMLRTNYAPGLVNGSLGTVVGFRRLVLDELPRYLLGNQQREEAIMQYSDFLQYEHGFQVPMVPVVDFNGRQIPVPPMTQFVGGLPNTHFYSMGINAIPLSLAYAFTVHKVQGLTLVGRVHLELSRMWPCEHLLYVAMSRVRNPEQLSVSSFRPGLVRAAADCLLFDDSLPTVWEAKIAPYMIAATWRRSPQRRKKVLLKKKLDNYVQQRKKRLMAEAGRGDIRAEIRLLEEQMLQQRARAAAKSKMATKE